MNYPSLKHTGLIPRFNAWLMHHGSGRYNRLTHERKRKLFSDLSGRVLEIGPGAGANLAYYPADVSLLCLEPNPYMQDHLQEKAKELGKTVEIITGRAEDIPIGDESVDAVVTTLVLCSVTDLRQSLFEIKRVLKPGGRFLFIEHVAAPANSWQHITQRWIKPVWKYLGDGCHPDRETWKEIEDAGFIDVQIEHFQLALPVVGPHIMGRAVKG